MGTHLNPICRFTSSPDPRYGLRILFVITLKPCTSTRVLHRAVGRALSSGGLGLESQ